jgi:hypothetical protein
LIHAQPHRVETAGDGSTFKFLPSFLLATPTDGFRPPGHVAFLKIIPAGLPFHFVSCSPQSMTRAPPKIPGTSAQSLPEMRVSGMARHRTPLDQLGFRLCRAAAEMEEVGTRAPVALLPCAAL